jgi:hypothetical protein
MRNTTTPMSSNFHGDSGGVARHEGIYVPGERRCSAGAPLTRALHARSKDAANYDAIQNVEIALV